jgi:hypothetical protein
MSTSSAQDCIDSAGRLAAMIDTLATPCTLIDVLMWCDMANVQLSRSTTAASEAIGLLVEELPTVGRPGRARHRPSVQAPRHHHAGGRLTRWL